MDRSVQNQRLPKNHKANRASSKAEALGKPLARLACVRHPWRYVFSWLHQHPHRGLLGHHHRTCYVCLTEGHMSGVLFCCRCGASLTTYALDDATP
jgi:hypothetical protein